MKKISLILGFLISWVSCVYAFAEHNVSQYIETIKNGSGLEKVKVYKTLYNYSGVTDEALFDLIAAQVKKSSWRQPETKPEQEEYHWGIKSLASSGNTKYHQLISNIARATNSRKTKRHAVNTLKRLSKFALFNPVINQTEYNSPERTQREAIRMRFIHNGNHELARFAVTDAARKLSFNDREFIEAVKKKLTEMYTQPYSNGDAIQFQSWACKYLLLAPDSYKHRSLVRKVSVASPNKAVKKWAKKSLKMY